MVGHQEKVAFIWSIAELLRGDYKQCEYGRVVLRPPVLQRRWQTDRSHSPVQNQVVSSCPHLRASTGNRSIPTSQSGSTCLRRLHPPRQAAIRQTAPLQRRHSVGHRVVRRTLPCWRHIERHRSCVFAAIASRTGYAPVTRLPRLPVRIGSENRAGGLTERSRNRPDRSPGACAPPDSMRACRKVNVLCLDSIEMEER